MNPARWPALLPIRSAAPDTPTDSGHRDSATNSPSPALSAGAAADDRPSRTRPRRRASRHRAGPAAATTRRHRGIKVGSAFFGWLTATGMAVLPIGVLAAAGVRSAWQPAGASIRRSRSRRTAAPPRRPSVWSDRSPCCFLLVSNYFGGYVAGRMARFHGLRQGLAVWLWGIVMAVIIAGIALIAGSQYSVPVDGCRRRTPTAPPVSRSAARRRGQQSRRPVRRAWRNIPGRIPSRVPRPSGAIAISEPTRSDSTW